MCDEEDLIKIVQTLHNNGNDMWSDDLRVKLGISEEYFIL